MSDFKLALACLVICAAAAFAWDAEQRFSLPPAPPAEVPTVNVPTQDRQENWIRVTGSCVHASFITLLRWQGQYKLAEYLRARYGGGETYPEFRAKLDKEGVIYSDTTSGNVAFLEWTIRTRRGACVTVNGGSHMVTLVHLDSERAALVDNNNPLRLEWVPREEFLNEWRRSSGWAITPIYSPAAPMP